MRLIVNAIPLTNLGTGIGRYLRCLYTAMEQDFSERVEIGYFDGREVRRSMPEGPADRKGWSRRAELFWKLPSLAALGVRAALHHRAERAFKKVCRDWDVYHEAAYFPFRAKGDLATVFTIHDMSLMAHPSRHPRERALFFHLYFPRRLPLADEIITVSGFTAREVKRLAKPGKIPVTPIPLAVDHKQFRPRSRDAVENLRAKHRLPRRYFLFVGSGDPRKNAEVIMPAIKSAGLDIPLVRAGWSGWGNEADQDGIINLGYVPEEELSALYSGAVALVFPSEYEGFGLPVLEAMSCGCPVATANLASMPEVAEEAAVFVQNPRDADELGRALSRIAGDKDYREHMIGLGLNRAKEFTWTETARRTLSVFENLVGGF